MESVGEVVLWDFDGTLAHRAGMWRGALVEALRGVDPETTVTDADVRPGLQNGFLWHAAHRAHPEIVDAAGWWAHMAPLFDAAYRRAGVPAHTARAATDRLPRVYTDPRSWTVFPDTRPALRLTRAAGLRNIVLSNHVPELPGLVAVLGLGDLVDRVVTSALAGFEKPHPGIFAVALEGRSADRAWMVGDNPVADVAGAEAVGIRALLVRDVPEHDAGWAARTILAQVRPDAAG